ncbi:MAG: biotin/lipoyl-binding protein [Lachnospiraceae bacterium]|nr:biotin/lipoyl-binding protein [Lachnospiraceae bacterium]MDY5496912.1 biotin/lipoyl-binding protein [Anaerobutyricum sp.]
MKIKKKMLAAIAIVLAVCITAGTIVFVRNRNKTVVKVYPVSMLNSADWYSDDSVLTGTLSSDFIQEVHVNSDQEVKKVYVKKGDKVKKGDILLKYKVDEKELDLKLQKLQIQSSQMEIDRMEKELNKLKNTKTVGSSNGNFAIAMGTIIDLSSVKAETTDPEPDDETGDKTPAQGSSQNTTEGDDPGEETKPSEEKVLYAKITDVDAQKDSSGGDGSASDRAYKFYLKKDGTVSVSVIRELMKEERNKFAEFIEYEKEDGVDTETGRYLFNPDTLFWNLSGKSEYTVVELNALAVKPKYKDLPKSADSTKDAVAGEGTERNPYLFYLQGMEKIDGSLLTQLIQDGKSAEFRKFESEEEYRQNKPQEKNILKISSSTKFGRTLESGIGYSISTLKKYSEEATTEEKSDTPSTQEKPVTPAAPEKQKIKFKQTRKKVKAGKAYTFTVEKENGDPVDQTKVTWKLSNNSSDKTILTKMKTGVVLYIDKAEEASSLTLTAQVKNVKEISTTKISKTLKVTGAVSDTGTGSGSSGSGSGSYNGGTSGGNGVGENGGGNSYTTSELNEEIKEKEDELSEAKEDLHEAKINYKEAKAEVKKATVRANISGTVTASCAKGTIPTDGSAAIIVKAADGMYVKTAISEMDLDSVKVGGTITCTSSDTGEEYEAEVKEISDFPTENTDSVDMAVSNPNSSYYPVVAFIKNADGLSTGGTVEVTYNSKSMGTVDEDAVVIHKAYIRTEDKKSYVYLRDNKTKRLKKQYVKIGKSIGGQYLQITSGVSQEDNIAFPYGKHLREGVKTKISEDDSEMIY